MQPHWNPLWVEVPVTVKIGGAYTANDVMGGTLSCDVPQVKGGGYIHAVRLVDDDDEKAVLTLYVFDAAPSTIADDAAHAPTKADWLKCIGAIAIAAADYDASGAEACAFVKGYDQKTGDYIIFDNLDAGKLYFRLVCTATPTYTAVDDLTLHVCLMLM
jgi:hypothetical protein